MAREESDRENLLREATALVRRIEFRVPHEAEPIVLGFRRDDAASVFFGSDPVYQFNAAGELRRAYVAGKLLKADQGTLAELTRVRTPTEVQLVRRDLSDGEAEKLLAIMLARLDLLRDCIESGSVEVIGQVSPDGDLLPAVRDELERLVAAPRVANNPRARSPSPRRGAE